MESVTSMDSTGAHALHDWIMDWRAGGIDVCITGTKGPIRDVLDKWNLIECVGADHVFIDDHSATAYFEQSMDNDHMEQLAPYALQSNVEKK
jgi:SulP family sulfate permease